MSSLGRSATSPLPFQPAWHSLGSKGYARPASVVAPARYCLLIGHRLVHRRLSHYGNRSPLSSDMNGKRRFGFNSEGGRSVPGMDGTRQKEDKPKRVVAI